VKFYRSRKRIRTWTELPRLSSSPIVVADASVIINLNATQCAAEILRSLPQRLAVVEVVCSELEEGRGRGRQDADRLQELVAANLIDVVRLGDIGDALFERLVVGPAISTVDDGEAATIAYAVENTLRVAIDDAKALRICREHFATVPRQCSVEIFQDAAVAERLGHDKLSHAVRNAMQVARMRVPPEHIAWVVELIGEEATRSCSSLPRHIFRTARVTER
jgi:predicted nucleic acid-binding protein